MTRFDPTDRYAHKRPNPDKVARAALAFANPRYGMTDNEKELLDAGRTILHLAASLEDELLNDIHRSGYRDVSTTHRTELHCDYHRALTGDNWVARARSAGL